MQSKRPTLAFSALAGVVLLATTLAGCGNVPAKDSTGGASQQPSTSTSAPTEKSDDSTPTTAPTDGTVELIPSVDDDATGVKVSSVVSVKADGGTVSKVKLWTKGQDKNGKTAEITVDGSISQDGSTWTAASALDPGSKYRLDMVGKNASDQATVKSKSSFTTEELGLNDQTFSTIQPAKGSLVGVGMPVILTSTSR